MATKAFDGSEQRPRPPISAHPAFPAIVAVWFAALLGLGSLVLPVVLLERLVGLTGLASLIPAAAPPFGMTARAALAVAAALGGAALGLAIARRLSAAHAAAPATAISDFSAETPRPLSVHDELGGEGVTNGHARPLTRRRALWIAEADPADDLPGELPDFEPLPAGGAPAAEAVQNFDPAPPAEGDSFEPSFTAGSELPAPEQDLAQALPTIADPDAFADEDEEMTDQQDFRPVSPFQEYVAPAEPADEFEAPDNAADVRDADPLPFAARSFSRRSTVRTEEATRPEPRMEREPELSPYTETEPQLAPVASQPTPAAPGEWQESPLAELGLVQLVQRLGATIEKRREWIAQGGAAAAPVASTALTGVEAARAEEAALAKAAYFGSAPVDQEPAETPSETPTDTFAKAIPEPGETALEATEEDQPALVALEPLAPGQTHVEPEIADEEPAPALRPAFLRSLAVADPDEDEDEGPLPDFSLPLRRPAALAPAMFDADDESAEDDEPAEEDEEEESINDDGFRSLLAMRTSATSPKQSIRIDESEFETDPAPLAAGFPDYDEPEDHDARDQVFEPAAFESPDHTPSAPATAQSPAPAEADAALRAALATLQRMGGNA